MNETRPKGDVLYGVPSIASFVHKTEAETRRLIEAGELPTFRIGFLICASKAALRTWRERRERSQ